MTESAEDNWHFVGKHSMRFEPPDLVFSRPNGDMSVEQHIKVLEFMESLPKPEKGLYVLINAGGGGRADPAIMKMPELRNRVPKSRATVYFNATFWHRTMIGVFQRANKVLKLVPTDSPIMIVESEAEARTWIDEHRKNS